MGYAPHEFKGFGLPVSRRVSLTDEGLDVLKLALHRRKVQLHWQALQFLGCEDHAGLRAGRRAPLWVAAMSEAGALRAARVGANLLPQGPRRQSLDPWLAQLEAEGRDPSGHRIGIIKSCLVTDDRERDWGKVRVAERRRMDIYHRFREEAGGHGGVQGIAEADRIPQPGVVATSSTA